jgi:FkbM family methyltransferase
VGWEADGGVVPASGEAMKTQTIQGPRGPFLIPAEPEVTAYHAARCCRGVFDGEYSYARPEPEKVRTLVDVGCNVGAFFVWASRWWPSLRQVYAYDPNKAACDLAFENAGGFLAPVPVLVNCCAVTSSRFDQATFAMDENWGASKTYGVRSGTLVPVVQPYELPPADVLKCDAEGVGHEVFSGYMHWSGVKVALYESHHETERIIMERACRAAGLHMVRGNPENPDGDVRVWVR